MTRSMALMMMAAVAVALGGHGVEGWRDDEIKVVQVGGKVLCQDCSKDWNHWAHGATPLQGCRVSVTCLDDRKRAVYYVDDETDERGEFEMMVNNYVDEKALKPQGCAVSLVSSPHANCSIATNFGEGKSGVKLSSPSHMYPDLVEYTVGPFYFTSPMCDEANRS